MAVRQLPFLILVRLVTNAVIFDLDGTLIDSVGDIHEALAELTCARGAAPLDLEMVRSFIGKGSSNLVLRCLKQLGLPHDATAHKAALDDFITIYTAGSAKLTTLFDGVTVCLQQLLDAGCQMAICTNKPLAPTQVVLKQFELHRFFDVVVGGDQLATRKPDPEMLHHAMAMLGVTDCLFVGDSEIDRATAAAGGQKIALFTKGYRQTSIDVLAPEYHFDHFADLPVIVAAHFKQAAQEQPQLG